MNMKMTKKELYEIMKCYTCKVDDSSITCKACSAAMEIEDFLSAPNSIFRKLIKKPECFLYNENGNAAVSDSNLNEFKINQLKNALLRAPGFAEIERLKIEGYMIEIIIRECNIDHSWILVVEVHLPQSVADPEYDHIIP